MKLFLKLCNNFREFYGDIHDEIEAYQAKIPQIRACYRRAMLLNIATAVFFCLFAATLISLVLSASYDFQTQNPIFAIIFSLLCGVMAGAILVATFDFLRNIMAWNGRAAYCLFNLIMVGLGLVLLSAYVKPLVANAGSSLIWNSWPLSVLLLLLQLGLTVILAVSSANGFKRLRHVEHVESTKEMLRNGISGLEIRIDGELVAPEKLKFTEQDGQLIIGVHPE